MKEYITNSPEETKQVAKKLINQLKGGEVIGLIGELGSGKTVFVQGLAEGLGIKEVVNSPSFVLMRVHEIKKSPRRESGQAKNQKINYLIHVDAYRLSNSQELREIGLGEYLGQKDNIVVIEWADKVKDLLLKGSMMINFEAGEGENQRVIII